MANTKIYAHRGASAYAPENTLEAFQLAIKMKADGIELDVQMSKDGILVITHDETIQRVSTGKGFVKDYTYEELLKFNFGKRFSEYEYVAIPTLEQVYQLLKDTDICINVELKNSKILYEGMEEKVIALTKEYGLEERVIYSSFNHYSVMKLKKLTEISEVAFLFEDGALDIIDYGIKHGVNGVHPALYHLQYPNFIEDAISKGMPLRVWTVNKEDDMKMIYELQLDSIITNYPDVGRKVVNEYGKNKE